MVCGWGQCCCQTVGNADPPRTVNFSTVSYWQSKVREAVRPRAAAPPDSGQWWHARQWPKTAVEVMVTVFCKKTKKQKIYRIKPTPSWCCNCEHKFWAECDSAGEGVTVLRVRQPRCWDMPVPVHRWHSSINRLFCQAPEVKPFAVSPDLPRAGMHYQYISTSLLSLPAPNPPPPPTLLTHSNINNNQQQQQEYCR